MAGDLDLTSVERKRYLDGLGLQLYDEQLHRNIYTWQERLVGPVLTSLIPSDQVSIDQRTRVAGSILDKYKLHRSVPDPVSSSSCCSAETLLLLTTLKFPSYIGKTEADWIPNRTLFLAGGRYEKAWKLRNDCEPTEQNR